MKRKHWIIVFVVFILADVVSCLFAIWAGGYRLSNRWINIGKPPEAAVKIIGIKIGDDPGGMIYQGRETSVFVETATGEKFTCCENIVSSDWQHVKEMDSNEAFYQVQCDRLANNEIVHIPNEKDQLGAKWCDEYDAGVVLYALTKDGTVWSRKVQQSPMRMFWLQLLIVVITIVLLYGLFILNNLINVFKEWKNK